MAEKEKTIWGERCVFDRETRWTRIYRLVSKENAFFHESRFQDSSACIPVEELRSQWHGWSESEQLDFSNALSQLNRDTLPDILRFLMNHGNPRVVSNIAHLIAYALPSKEAASFLLAECEKSQPGDGANFFGALAKTDYDERLPFLKQHLQLLVENPYCWEKGTNYFNEIANEVVYRIRDLLDLGEPKEQFVHLYARLKEHPHEFVRTVTKNFLKKRFEGSNP